MKNLIHNMAIIALICGLSMAASAQETPEATPEANAEQLVAPAPEIAEATENAEAKKEKQKKKKRKKAEPEEEPAYDIPLIETQNESHAALDVNYVTGGIGDEERALIEASKNDYNLHVSNAGADGSFFGDTRVVIARVAQGSEPVEMLNVVAGPLLYVKLPQGRYTLEAHRGETVKQFTFTIGRKPHRLSLGWK